MAATSLNRSQFGDSRCRRPARPFLLSRSPLHQPGDHHRRQRQCQTSPSPSPTPSPLGAWPCSPPRTRRAGQRHIEPQSLSGLLRRSRSARHAHPGRSGLHSRRRLQLLRQARRRQPQAPARRLVLAGRRQLPKRPSPSNPAASAARSSPLEAKRIGKFKLTLSARMNGAARDPRRHRRPRNRSHSQRARAEPRLQRPPRNQRSARSALSRRTRSPTPARSSSASIPAR